MAFFVGKYDLFLINLFLKCKWRKNVFATRFIQMIGKVKENYSNRRDFLVSFVESVRSANTIIPKISQPRYSPTPLITAHLLLCFKESLNRHPGWCRLNSKLRGLVNNAYSATARATSTVSSRINNPTDQDEPDALSLNIWNKALPLLFAMLTTAIGAEVINRFLLQPCFYQIKHPTSFSSKWLGPLKRVTPSSYGDANCNCRTIKHCGHQLTGLS